MTTHMTLSAGVLVAIGWVATAAQSPQHTGAIAGAVVSADAARTPIPRAVVTLAGAALERNLVALTDQTGRFGFDALPPGQFALTASKATYLSMAYGQATPGRGSGLPVSLAAGQRVDSLTWMLPKGGIISGRVIDEEHEPIAQAFVTLMQQVTSAGERRLVEKICCSMRTDAAGSFRLYGVPPGTYLLTALPPGDYRFMPDPWTANPPEVRETGAAEVEWAMRRLAGGSDREPPAGRALTYTRVFHPGTPQPDQAAPVTIGAGEERGGFDISMRLLPSARISGRAIGPDGTVVRNARVSIGGASWSAPDGTFVQRNLTPGSYPVTMRDAAARLWGREVVEVAGDDVDADIRLGAAARISGRVVFTSTSNTPPPESSAVRLTLSPASSSVLGGTQIGADGTFTISGMDPGGYRLVPSIVRGRGAASSPWVLESAMLNGRDLADVPIDIRAGDAIDEVVVTFTDRVTELSGTLQDAAGRPAPGLYVLVMPADAPLRTAGTRRMPAPARAATDGTFRFSGLPPGAYVLAALAGVEPGDLEDAVFLKQVAAAGIAITLAEGEKKTQDVRFAK